MILLLLYESSLSGVDNQRSINQSKTLGASACA